MTLRKAAIGGRKFEIRAEARGQKQATLRFEVVEKAGGKEKRIEELDWVWQSAWPAGSKELAELTQRGLRKSKRRLEMWLKQSERTVVPKGW